MKKVFLFVFALCTAFLSADEDPVFTGLKGGYAIYEDSRYDSQVYIAVCYVGNDSVIMRSYEPETGNDLAIKATFKNIDGILDYDPTMTLLKGEIESSEASTRLLPQILVWANTWFSLKDSIEVETLFNGKDGYNFSYWIPVFQISSIGKNNGLKLITAGVANSETDPDFFDFKGLPKPGYSPSYTIKKAETLNPEIDGISIPLDANWEKVSESQYNLSQFSDEDATITVSTERPADSGINSIPAFAMLHMIAVKGKLLLAEGSDMFITDGILNLKKRTYDVQTSRVYIHQMQFLPRGNGFVSVAELTVLESIYLKNKGYINSILY